MHEALAESDALVDELLSADLIVAGVPMYNFGMPAGFKAYIDNIVRVGRTFGFDRDRAGEPYWPLLAGQGNGVYCLGTGRGFTVREVIDASRAVTNREVPVIYGDRRPGDAAALVSSSTRAMEELGWSPDRSTLRQMIGDAWAWAQRSGRAG